MSCINNSTVFIRHINTLREMVVHSMAATVARLLPREDWNDEGSESNCVWVEPGPNGNVPITACNAYYNYDPQFAPAVAVAVIFGVLTGIHLFEAIVFKKVSVYHLPDYTHITQSNELSRQRYMWVLIMGILWETLAFTIHSLGARDQQQLGYAMAWNLLFLLAPLWINAFAYMTFARMVHYWHPERKVAGLRATAIARWFVLADILSFIVQGVGGIMASPDADANIIRIGLNIYLAGMGLQQFFIVIFLGLMVAFQRRCTHANVEDSAADGKRSWKPLLFALYGVLVCITVSFASDRALISSLSAFGARFVSSSDLPSLPVASRPITRYLSMRSTPTHLTASQ